MNARWLFPFAVTVHNAEEAIWLPAFRSRHGWNSISATQFRAGAFLVALLAFAVTLCNPAKPAQPGGIMAFLCVLLDHAAQRPLACWCVLLLPSLRSRSYHCCCSGDANHDVSDLLQSSS
jgi:hypothetical protein